jgi:hypothetical protein
LFTAGQENGIPHLFQDHFDRRPFLFEHRLAEDPLFDLSCICALAERLPGKVSYNGDLAIDNGWRNFSAKKATFQQSLGQLQDGHSWIILKRVQEDAGYGPILRQCLHEAEALTNRRLDRLIESRTMSLILSSPAQVTPYHVDADCNFLFQLRGTKTLYVFNGKDRSILPEEEEENFWAGNLSAAHFREANQAKAWPFSMKPGNGVHIPVMYPHWVKNDSDISVSLSINFRFNGSMYGNVYRMNHFLRKMGLRPRPAGQSRVADSLKAWLIEQPRAAAKLLRKLCGGQLRQGMS